MSRKIPKCGFCGLPEEQVGMMAKGKTASHLICFNCTKNINSFIEKQEQAIAKASVEATKLPLPREMVSFLDQFVIGQQTAKKVLSVGVYNHYKRLMSVHFNDDPTEIEKSNIMLIGSTGSGKTLLARTLARMLHVPFAIGDATTLTEAGYVGEDVENLILKLLHASDFDVSAAEKGIIFVDEIDKVASKTNNVSITRDVSGEGVQQSLLKMLEGTVSSVPAQGGRKHPEQKYISVNTTNILFVVGGTFVGLKDIIGKRVDKKTIGFVSSADKSLTDNELLEQVTAEDLIQYGMIPELIGRLPIIAPLLTLTEEDLLRVVQEPKNSLTKQYQKLFRMEGCELEFTDDALRQMVRMALKQETGARGLRSVLEGIMLDIMYSLPEQPKEKYVITEKVVRGETKLFGKEAN